MRLVLLALALLAAPAIAQPDPVPDILRWLESRPRRDLRPTHDSAARALGYSAAATVGGAAVGYALYRVLPSRPDGEFSPDVLGLSVVLVAVLIGPSVGPVTLGADDDAAGRGVAIRTAGLVGGLGVVAGGFLVCLATEQTTSYGRECPSGSLFLGAAVAGTALVAGTAVDLASIPRYARLARIERAGRPVTVRPAGAGLAVRVPL